MRTPDRQPSVQYAAFISYNRGVDKQLAKSIQTALHRFAKPWYRLRAVRVFRDDSSLAANPGLWTSVQLALDASEFLILLASPQAALSTWVRREVSYWLSCHPRDKLVVALTDGAIHWDDQVGDFEWRRTTALPDVLKGTFGEAPRYIDMRSARQMPSLLSSPVFREMVADLAAPLHHRPKDELFGEDLRVLRRNRTLAGSAAVALAVLAVAATLFAIDSRTQTRIALVNGLISQSDALRDSDPATALRLAIAAFGTNPSPPTRAGIVRRLLDSRYAGDLPDYAGEVSGLFVNTQGSIAVIGGGEEPSVVWDVTDATRPKKLATLDHPKGVGWETGPTYAIAASPDGRLVLDGNSVWDLSDAARPLGLAPLPDRDDRAKVPTWTVAYNAARSLGLTGGGRNGSRGETTGMAALWDLTDPRRPVRVGELAGHVGPVWSAAFSPDGRTVITGSDGTAATVWDVSTPSAPLRVAELPGHPGPVWTASVSPDGNLAVTGSSNGYAALWDIHVPATPQRLANLAGHVGNVWTAAFSAGSTKVVTGSAGDTTAIVWDVSSPSQPRRVAGLPNDSAVSVVSFDQARGRVVTSTTGGSTRAWSDRELVVPMPASAELSDAIAFNDAGTIAVTDPSEAITLDVWETDKGLARRLVGTLQDEIFGDLTADGSTLVTLSVKQGDGLAAKVWDLTGSRPQPVLALPGADPSMSPDGSLLTLASDGGTQVALWSIADRSAPRELSRFAFDKYHSADGMVFSRDSRLMGDPGHYETLVWDISDPTRPKQPAVFTGSSVAFSPNGRLALIGVNGTTQVWDMADPQQPVELSTLDGTGAIVSPGGRLVVTNGRSSALLWDLSYPTQPHQLTRIEDHDAYAVSAGGTVVHADIYDRPVAAFDVSTVAETVDDPLHRACTLATRGPSVDEWHRYAPGLPYRDFCQA